jgi:DNA-binding response OmpR family regulator
MPADLLLVENDRRLGELLAAFLERHGHRVRRATSFAEARSLLRDAPPGLLLSDLELGAEDARAILPALAAEGLLPPTLVVSGYLDTAATRALASVPGVVGFVPKPFEFGELLAAIDAALVPK